MAKKVKKKYAEGIIFRTRMFSEDGFRAIIVVKTLRSTQARKEELP